MAPDDPAATAEGDFRKTPLPHLLVYMADRRLTGVLFLREPEGTEHVVRFEWGAPVRVAPGDGFAMFGEMLVEAGIVNEEVVSNALATKGLLGDVLILTGHAEADELESVASEQLVRRMVRLFGLPAETTYRYFDGHKALADTAPGCRAEVLRLLNVGLRAHPRLGLPLGKLMERLGDLPLKMHPDARLERFGFDEDETAVVMAILRAQPTFVELLASEIPDSIVVRRVVYTLLLTRQMDLGQKTLPLGCEDLGPPIALGRLNLASAIHRIGAAAPDPVGDGERAAVMPRTLRRRQRRKDWDERRAEGTLEGLPIVAGDPEEEMVSSDVLEVVSVPVAASSGEHPAPPEDHDIEPVSDVIETGPRSPEGTSSGAAASCDSAQRDTGTGGKSSGS
ncbi:MAG: hypothetical protein U0441_19940 [Polyangiaceae bacterium]